MIRLSKNPDAPGGKSYVLQRISFCQPANGGAGAARAARSNKKGIRKLTAGENSQSKPLLETRSMYTLQFY